MKVGHVYPPKLTSSPDEMLNNMWLSVARAGPVFAENGRVIPREGDDIECVFYLAPGGVSKETRKPLEKYMRGYTRASGWSMKSLRFTNSYAAFVIAPSKALSKTSRKP
jgi:hypothetical protein